MISSAVVQFILDLCSLKTWYSGFLSRASRKHLVCDFIPEARDASFCLILRPSDLRELLPYFIKCTQVGLWTGRLQVGVGDENLVPHYGIQRVIFSWASLTYFP